MEIRHAHRTALVVLAAIVVATAVAVGSVVWTGRDSASSAGAGSLPQHPSAQFASKVVHYTMTEYTNYEARASSIPVQAQLDQTTLITERWVELDSSGNLRRAKNVTRLPSGEIWQERLYVKGTEVVNWYRHPGSGVACSQTGKLQEQPGSSLPFASSAQLSSAGFAETNRSSDIARAAATGQTRAFERSDPRSPAPGLASGRSAIVRDEATDQRLADLFYGVDAAGDEVLLQSTTFSPVVVDPVPDGRTFTIEALPPGCGRPQS